MVATKLNAQHILDETTRKQLIWFGHVERHSYIAHKFFSELKS
jgi:hypothetical protein